MNNLLRHMLSLYRVLMEGWIEDGNTTEEKIVYGIVFPVLLVAALVAVSTCG